MHAHTQTNKLTDSLAHTRTVRFIPNSGAVDTSVASGSLAAGPLVVAVARSRSWVLGADDDDLIADIHKR